MRVLSSLTYPVDLQSAAELPRIIINKPSPEAQPCSDHQHSSENPSVILLTACLEDGAVITVNVDSEQKISAPGRNFEDTLTFNNELVANASDLDEDGTTKLAMGLAFDDDSGIDTGTILINFMKYISYITVYISYSIINRRHI